MCSSSSSSYLFLSSLFFSNPVFVFVWLDNSSPIKPIFLSSLREKEIRERHSASDFLFFLVLNFSRGVLSFCSLSNQNCSSVFFSFPFSLFLYPIRKSHLFHSNFRLFFSIFYRFFPQTAQI